jgi:mRNA interferase MazF
MGELLEPVHRRQVWLAEPDPVVVGREQAGGRPVLVISTNGFNNSRAGLVMVLPITTTERGFFSHVPLEPTEGGLRRKSFVMCEQIKSMSKDRLKRSLGEVQRETMIDVQEVVRILLGL